MTRIEIERIEVKLLIDAIFERYGYDFRGYARSSITRRVKHFMEIENFCDISDMIPRLIHDKKFFQKMVVEFSITVTEMFRDPSMYLAIREKVVPFLKSYPFVKIWHAGCATGEEVYSLSILLREEEITDRATLYATDFNDAALSRAMAGIYPLDHIKSYTSNYQQAGGTHSFSEYYHASYDAMVILNFLKNNITFANHNLVTDSVFSETHLIFCRNVLIYFNKELQSRVLNLFYESLVQGGFLCLGSKESLLFSSVQDNFRIVDEKNRIYQKKI